MKDCMQHTLLRLLIGVPVLLEQHRGQVIAFTFSMFRMADQCFQCMTLMHIVLLIVMIM